MRALYRRFEQLWHELAKFGVVGAVAFVTDVTAYNLLRLGFLTDKPTLAKLVSALLAMAVAFAGNRFWTYRQRERTGYARETTLFLVFNLIGIGIALACQAFSHYVLGLDSLLADNISANGVGLVLGTAFRFWSYRRFVFPHTPAAEPVVIDYPAAGGTGGTAPSASVDPRR